MKAIYTKPSLMVQQITNIALLIGSGDNSVGDDKITAPDQIAAKPGFADFDDADDAEY